MDERRHLKQFLLFAFVLIVPCFALWTLVMGPVAMPVVGLADMLLTAWFPDVVERLSMDGSDALLVTRFGESNGVAVPLEQAEYQLAFKLSPGVLSYSIPFYAALHFATQKEEYLQGFITGLLLLYPCFLMGMISLCLKELMVQLGVPFLEQPDVFVPNGNLIALFYQLNVLIVPTVAPALVWAWQSRDTELLRGVLKLLPASQASEE